MSILPERGAALALIVLALAAPRQAAAQEPDADSRLFDAVQRLDRTAVEALVADGVDVNAIRADGSTPLSWAAFRDDADIAAALLRAGADPDPWTRTGRPVALRLRQRQSGPSPASSSMPARTWTPRAGAATRRCSPRCTAATRDWCGLLLDRGADPNATESRMGQTPLMWAIAGGHPSIARLLVGHGADVRAVSRNGFRPILFAAQHGDAASARALLDAGPTPTSPPPDGSTAFPAGHRRRQRPRHPADARRGRQRRRPRPHRQHAAARGGAAGQPRDGPDPRRPRRRHERPHRTGRRNWAAGSRRTGGLTPFLTAARPATWTCCGPCSASARTPPRAPTRARAGCCSPPAAATSTRSS